MAPILRRRLRIVQACAEASWVPRSVSVQLKPTTSGPQDAETEGMTKKRRNHSPQKKAEIVRRHLVDKVPVSDLCDEYKIQPSVFYGWQKQVLDGLEGFFEDNRGGNRARKVRERESSRERQKIEALEAKIARKDFVIAEISEQHIKLKKSLGDL